MLLRDVCLQWPWNVISGECYETLLKASKTEADFVLGRSVGMPSEKKSFFSFFVIIPREQKNKKWCKRRENQKSDHFRCQMKGWNGSTNTSVAEERGKITEKWIGGGAGGVKCPDSGVHR